MRTAYDIDLVQPLYAENIKRECTISILEAAGPTALVRQRIHTGTAIILS